MAHPLRAGVCLMPWGARQLRALSVYANTLLRGANLFGCLTHHAT